MDSLKCIICDKVFKRKKNLNEHILKVHNISKENTTKSNISCPECCASMSSHAELVDHVKSFHNTLIEVERLSFQSHEDFKSWKDKLEVEEKTFFRIARTYKTALHKHISYKCHRSADPRPRHAETNDGSKLQKSQGSCKIKGQCTAALQCKLTDSLVEVTYTKTHFGHEMELKHMPIAQIHKEELSAKLSAGVSMKHIMNEVRSSVDNSLERIHLLTKKDLHNLAEKCGASHPEKLHKNDAVSVKIFVNKFQHLGVDSPVLFFKEQGKCIEGFAEEDFMLIFMTKGQGELLSNLGKSKICMDSTHGTNSYDFHLTTVMVVDEFNTGFPAAFCISNKIDTFQMENFFEVICRETSPIMTKVFMSDDAPVYYNAWCKVMGAPKNRLLCTWHVDKCWRKNLVKIKRIEKREEVYKYARAVLECTEEDYLILVSKFLKNLEADEDTRAFGAYFSSFYLNRPHLWAYCYREHLGINTNMYLESLHRTLKHVYMNGNVGQRLDVLLFNLETLVRDKTFDRFRMLIKGGCPRKAQQNLKRHRDSKSITLNAIEVIEAGSRWKVQSETCKDLKYTVAKLPSEEVDCNSCRLTCIHCHICVHTYVCNCLDNLIRYNICKHIHAVHMNFSSTTSSSTCSSVLSAESNILKSKSFQDYSNKFPLGDTHKLKAKMQYAFSLLPKNLEEHQHHKVDSLLDNLIQVFSESTVPPSNSEPPNKKIKMQTRLFSTKKKRKEVKNNISKPSTTYKYSILNAVRKNEETVHIHSGNDHTY